jgi:hypothetical protein
MDASRKQPRFGRGAATSSRRLGKIRRWGGKDEI